MPIWLDEDTIEGEMPNEEFIRKVNEQMAARVEKEMKEDHPGNYGNDGLITIYEETCSHNGIAYELKVLRYFAVTRLGDDGFELRDNKGMNLIGKHVVVESERSNYELQEFLGLSEFLWHDTLHSGQEDWSLLKQWEYIKQLAIDDCERVPRLKEEFNVKIKTLRKELQNFIKHSSKKT